MNYEIWEVFQGILFFIIGIFAITWTVMAWRSYKYEMKIYKLEKEVHEYDRRLCRLEGAFASKDCCMIKDHRISEKAE